MLKIPLHKKILSYFYPILLKKGSSPQNPFLELLLYRNEYQLATKDALYSDGKRYRPLVDAFDFLGEKLKAIDSILVLGAGLGSAVQILNSKGLYPQYTMVDHDATILGWIKDIAEESHKGSIQTVCADAQEFMATGGIQTYDMVIVDVFDSRVVPHFVCSIEFMLACRGILNTKGHFILNYIINDTADWQEALNNIEAVFPDSHVLSNDINRIIVATTV